MSNFDARTCVSSTHELISCMNVDETIPFMYVKNHRETGVKIGIILKKCKLKLKRPAPLHKNSLSRR